MWPYLILDSTDTAGYNVKMFILRIIKVTKMETLGWDNLGYLAV